MPLAASSVEVVRNQRLPYLHWRYPAEVLLLAGTYLLGALLGLRFAFAGANVSPLWPPTGLAIAALVLFGRRLWPGVLLGAFLANLVVSPLPVGVAMGIAAGNCLEAVLAATLLRQVAFHPAFPRFQDTLAWIAFASVAGPLASASLGTWVLASGGVLPRASLGQAWMTWFSGDALGALVIGPLLLAWAHPWGRSGRRAAMLQALGPVALLTAVASLVFLTPLGARADLSPLAFATLPPLLWLGHRFGARGATLGTLLVASLAIWGTAGGLGAYAGFRELNDKMRLLQAFIALAAASSLGFATLLEERDLAREKRRMSEEGFQRLVESVKDYAIYLLDTEGRVVSWNEGAARIKGYSAAEILGEPVARFYPPEEIAEGRPGRDLEEAARHGSLEREGWRIRKDGSRFFANITLTAIQDGHGGLKGFSKVTRDITDLSVMMDRLRAHKQELEAQVQLRTRQLAQSQQTLYLVYDGVQDPMAMVEPDGGGGFRIASCNRACAHLLGASPRELVGRPATEAAGPDAAEEVLRALQEAARTGLSQSHETPIRGPEGECVFDLQVIPILDDAGECAHVLVAGRDITARLRAEEAARKAQKLESLELMAGGIAHDFNNILTAIMGHVDLGLMATEPGSRARASFEHIEQGALRASELTRQLLAYTGKGRFRSEPMDLNGLVEEVTRMFPSTLPHQVHLRIELRRPLPMLEGDPGQLQQMVLSLLTNAAEAIRDGRDGYITLRTGLRYLEKDYLKAVHPALDLTPGEYATLEVTDTGMGMAPEVQARIFDPFFTTKFTGRGLGLPALLGILRSHRGGVEVFSEPGVGSTFTVFLPVAATALPAPAPEPEASWRWTGTILLVDDDGMILDLSARIARHLGLTVLQARDGLEAMEHFQAHHQELCLVVMDLTMPRMDGREAFGRMRELDPEVPIILTSGYSEQEVVQPFLDQGLAAFLQKPYRREALVSALRKGLSRSPRAQEGSGPLRTV